jgi:hypothetical protein
VGVLLDQGFRHHGQTIREPGRLFNRMPALCCEFVICPVL